MAAWIRTRAKPCRSLNLTAPTRCKLRFHPLRFHGESPLFPYPSISYSTSLFLFVPFLLPFFFLSRVFIFLPLFLSFSSFPFLSFSFLCFVHLVLRDENLLRYISCSFLIFSFSPLFLLQFFCLSLSFLFFLLFRLGHACFATRVFSFCIFPSFICFFLCFFKNFFPYPLSRFFFLAPPFQFFFFSRVFSLLLSLLSFFFLFFLRLSFLYFISSFIFLREFHSNRVDTSHVYNSYVVLFSEKKIMVNLVHASSRFVLFFSFRCICWLSKYLYLQTFDRDIM